MSVAETGQLSAVETRQMSAAETGQMSAVEARQVSTIATGRCLVLILYIYFLSTADNCLVSTADICLVSAADIGPVLTAGMSSVARADICYSVDVSEWQLWQCHNVQVSDRRSRPESAKIVRNESRMVART